MCNLWWPVALLSFVLISWVILLNVHFCSPTDPYQWEPDQSHRWAEWTLKLYNLPVSYVMDFYMNGTIMCMLSQDEFRRRCPEFGDYLYAELDLWKSGKSFKPSHDSCNLESPMKESGWMALHMTLTSVWRLALHFQFSAFCPYWCWLLSFLSAAYSFISSPLHSSSSSSSGHSDDEELKYQAMDDLSSSAPSFTSLTPSQSTLTSTQLSAIPTPVIMPNTRAGQSYTLSDSFSHHQREPTLLQAAQGHTRLLSGGGCISRSVQPCVSPAPSLGSSGDASWSSSPSLLHEDRSEGMLLSPLLPDDHRSLDVHPWPCFASPSRHCHAGWLLLRPSSHRPWQARHPPVAVPQGAPPPASCIPQLHTLVGPQ